MSDFPQKTVLTRRALIPLLVGGAVAVLPSNNSYAADGPAPDPLVIMFTGKVSHSSISSMQEGFFWVREKAGNVDSKNLEILLLINSEGGDVDSGIEMYNFIRAFPIKCTSYNISTVASSATLIYLGAGRRLCTRDAKFLIHGVTFDSEIKQATTDYFAGIVAHVDLDNKHLAEIYADRTKINFEDATKMLRDQNWIDSGAAFKFGITTENDNDLILPTGASPIRYRVSTD